MMSAFGLALDGTSAVMTQAAIKQTTKAPVPVQPTASQGGMAVTMTRRGITVSGIYAGGKKGPLTLLKGSPIDLAATVYPNDKSTPTRRQDLLAQGKLFVQNGSNVAILQEDYELPSPSAAARFAFGGSCDGRRDFKDASGQSIKAVWG